MSTVYLDRRNLEIAVEGARLRVNPSAHGRDSIPLRMITRLVIVGTVRLDSASLAALAERGIAVVFLGGRGLRRVAQLTGTLGNDARRRLAQYRAAQNADQCLDYARWLVALKVKASRQETCRLLEHRHDARRALVRALEQLEGIETGLQQGDVSALRGKEGAAAGAWYRALAAVLPGSLGFKGRNRRPPRDPVNAVLSLAYTMAHAEAVAACYAHGLDPMVGFLHEPAHGRESLACDLIEPLRPHLDARLVRLFAEQSLRAEHFDDTPQGCRLDKAGRRHFYQWWEKQGLIIRRYFRVTLQAQVRDLLGRGS